MGKRYMVTAEYVTMSTADPLSGKRVLLGWYRNALLPEDITEEAIRHHLSTGQIAEWSPDFVAAGTPEATPLTEEEEQAIADGLGPPNRLAPAVGAASNDQAGPQTQVMAGDDVPEPRKNAKRAAWVDYAVSKGGDREEIEANEVSQADLIATWGTPKH